MAMSSSVTGRTLLPLLCAIAMMLPAGLAHAGFGVSPPLLREERLTRGSTLERIIYLVQGTPERDLQVELFVDSSAKEWITFPQGNPITIPKGVQQFPLAVSVAIPETADLGVYKGQIRITTVPEKADQAGEVAIAIGGLVEIDLTVGKDVFYDLKTKVIKILDIKEGDKPEVDAVIVNNGNAPAAPEAATFELFNKYGEIRLAYAETKEFTKVPAFEEKTQHLSFPVDIHIAPGEYWGHVKVYGSNRSLIGELRTVFNVTDKTFMEAYGTYVLFGSAAGGVVLILLLVIILLLRRSRHREPFDAVQY